MLKANENRRGNLGKFLSWILRHGALKDGIPIKTDGFVSVDDLLEHSYIKGRFTRNEIIKVVETDEKSRFTLRYNETRLEIRANQGHSIKVQNLELTPITDATNFECVVHGTFLRNWSKIKLEGLHRMQNLFFRESLQK